MTEKESLLAQQQELFLLEQMLSDKKLSLSELEMILPALFHVNNLDDSTLVYCSQKACDYVGIEVEELMPYSAEQLATICSDYTMAHVIPTFVKFYQQEDYYKVFGNFQQLMIRGKDDYEWVYTTTKIYHDLNAAMSLTIPIKQMGSLSAQLTGLLEDNLFIKKNYQRFASLTKQECVILKMIVSGQQRRHIAERLSISLHTYDTHRKNIRQKLDTKSLSELIRYAQAFGLGEE